MGARLSVLLVARRRPCGARAAASAPLRPADYSCSSCVTLPSDHGTVQAPCHQHSCPCHAPSSFASIAAYCFFVPTSHIPPQFDTIDTRTAQDVGRLSYVVRLRFPIGIARVANAGVVPIQRFCAREFRYQTDISPGLLCDALPPGERIARDLFAGLCKPAHI